MYAHFSLFCMKMMLSITLQEKPSKKDQICCSKFQMLTGWFSDGGTSPRLLSSVLGNNYPPPLPSHVGDICQFGGCNWARSLQKTALLKRWMSFLECRCGSIAPDGTTVNLFWLLSILLLIWWGRHLSWLSCLGVKGWYPCCFKSSFTMSPLLLLYVPGWLLPTFQGIHPVFDLLGMEFLDKVV